MPPHIVAWDLNHEVKRPPLLAEVQHGDNWAKLSESCYMIWTPETAHQIYNRLFKFLDSDDTLYVVPVTYGIVGQGPPIVNKWFDLNVLPWAWAA